MKKRIILFSVFLLLPFIGLSKNSREEPSNDAIVDRIARFIGVWELFESRDLKTGEIIKNPLSLRIEFLEDGIRDCLLSRGLGDVYKRQDFSRL